MAVKLVLLGLFISPFVIHSLLLLLVLIVWDYSSLFSFGPRVRRLVNKFVRLGDQLTNCFVVYVKVKIKMPNEMSS